MSAVEEAIAALKKGMPIWAGTPLAERRMLLERVHAATAAHAEEWVAVATMIKQLTNDTPLVGEEWFTCPYPVLTATAALADSLRALERGGSPVDGFRVAPAPGNRVAVQVLPHDIFDWLLFNGFRAEVWSRPGVGAATVRERAGQAQRAPSRGVGIGAVLGAGNIFSIAPLDTLYGLYAHNRVVALKLNPIMDPLLSIFEKVFAPFIERDFVRILTGGAEVGTALVRHPDVDSVHMTGSVATHDEVVFGTGPDGRARKAANEPVLDKPITSELGGVSPTIVVPGQWTASDLRFHAEHIATQRLHNGGYNCVAAQVVIISADWPQKQQFLTELRRAFDRAPARAAYYPGSDGRVASAREAYPSAIQLGPDRGRILLLGLSPTREEQAFREEYFAPVLGVTELQGEGPAFLRGAVETANNELAGTLGVNIVVDTRTQRELGNAVEEAIAELRYGTVAVNAWTGVGYLMARASWGAFPGHTIDDVQSGIGVVHNALLIDEPERTVVRGPFRPAPRSILQGEFTLSPKPPWFVTNRTAAITGRRLVGFAANPRWRALPAIFSSALRG